MLALSLLLSSLSALCTVTLAAPSDDLRRLQASCVTAADVLNASLNNTGGMDTSGLLMNITWQIGASNANLAANNTKSASATTINSNNATSNNSTIGLDDIYFDYADSLDTLSEAVIRRGRIFHAELNQPVYDTLQGMAVAVHAYGQALTSAGLIHTNSTIRTITAGSAIVQAESAWDNNLNYPGRFLRRG